MKLDDTKVVLEAVTGEMSATDLLLAGMKGVIAAEITMKRQDLGMNQSQFAKLMGVTQSLVSKWEAGETNFTLETLCRIAANLNIDMQCPFVMKGPRSYYRSVGMVIPLRNKAAWQALTPNKIELKEM